MLPVMTKIAELHNILGITANGQPLHSAAMDHSAINQHNVMVAALKSILYICWAQLLVLVQTA